jgi:hypothetical protein
MGLLSLRKQILIIRGILLYNLGFNFINNFRLPHYGHILAGTMKDIVTRYAHQTGNNTIKY